jgi:hypothetical protein
VIGGESSPPIRGFRDFLEQYMRHNEDGTVTLEVTFTAAEAERMFATFAYLEESPYNTVMHAMYSAVDNELTEIEETVKAQPQGAPGA